MIHLLIPTAAVAIVVTLGIALAISVSRRRRLIPPGLRSRAIRAHDTATRPGGAHRRGATRA